MHIRYSSGFKLVSSWMNKYDLIRFVHICINIYLSHNQDVGLIYCLFESAFMHLLRNFFFPFLIIYILFSCDGSNGEIRKKVNTKNKNKETITRENQDKSKSENQEMITGENQEVANAENHEMITSENQEHEAATSVVGRSLRSGFSNSSLSPGTINIH